MKHRLIKEDQIKLFNIIETIPEINVTVYSDAIYVNNLKLSINQARELSMIINQECSRYG